MRGKQLAPLPPLRGMRIIPAHAGQTPCPDYSSRLSPDHPRACGANEMMPEIVLNTAGSSPRMRGKHSHKHLDRLDVRIIPAHAGQTKPQYQQYRRPTDHPRACGANSETPRPTWRQRGSSPRMRGKRNHPPPLSHRCRIIPAHAGQTYFRGERWQWDADHPRACGANSL